MWITLTILLTIFLLLPIYFKNYLRVLLVVRRLPQLKADIIFGNADLVNDSKTLEYMGTYASKLYGKLIVVWLSIVPIVLIVNPQYLKQILGNNNRQHTEKNLLYRFMHNFVGQGMITNNGPAWREPRKLIQPYFGISTLRKFVPIFAQNAHKLIVDLMQIDKCPVKISDHINRCVLQNLYVCILGLQHDYPIEEQSPFRSGKLMILQRLLKPWLLLDFIFNWSAIAAVDERQKYTLQEYVAKIVHEKRHHKNSTTSLIDIFLMISRENPQFSEVNVINETCTFMLAGQDSVGSAVAFTLYYLAKYQEIQEKCWVEIQQRVIEENRQFSDLDTINTLHYLEQCIKETMRLCPSVPLLARKLTEDLQIGQETLPEGMDVFISPFVTHRLPEYFPNPLDFDPDRFSDENTINAFAYFPFSAGSRNCIGHKFAMFEMKTMIAILLQNFRLKLAPGYEKLGLTFRVTLRAKNGINLCLEKRS